MTVVIDPQVYDVLDEFYEKSREAHVTLGLSECLAKIDRLEHSMLQFAEYAEVFHKEPYREDWRKAGYYEYITEDFHFAYRVYVLPNGEKVLRYHDAVHSFLNYNQGEEIDRE